MKRQFLLSLVVLPIAFHPLTAFAQWPLDGALLSAPNATGHTTLVSNGEGGAIVTWYDNRNGNNDIFVQHVDSSGVGLWTSQGVAVCTAADSQTNPEITSDNAGGVIVTWMDQRSGSNFDVYAQRIDATGTAQWTADGVAIGVATNNQINPVILPDGSGGAFIVWWDNRGTDFDIYAQRIDAAGATQWTANGVAICAATDEQQDPTMVSDASGGVIVAWEDRRAGNYDIYAQRVNAAGAVQWTADGVAICTEGTEQALPALAIDASGGVWIAWMDYRSAAYDIYVQRVNASGTPQYTPNGFAICSAAYSQSNPRMVPDGSGGFIATWWDGRASGTTDIYAQRVNPSAASWQTDGVAICTAANLQRYPDIVGDGAGGAVITWEDHRAGQDVYAQRVTASGVTQWTTDGVPVCTAQPSSQLTPRIASNGSGGAIIAWTDVRPGAYAQRIEGTRGFWGDPRPTITSVADVAADQGGKAKVNWTSSDADVWDVQTITRYSVWRATDAVALAAATAQGEVVTTPSDIPADFQGNALWVQHAPAADYYWEWLANVDAHYLAAYSYTASTRSDSTLQGASDERFFVSAHTSNAYVFFDSEDKSGHSVDNLAPAAPLFLMAQRSGLDVNLTWNRVHVSDLKNYAVYRATSSGVTPIPGNFLASNTDSMLVDSGAPASTLYYIVTAYDVHGNQSPASNEASVSAPTGAGNLPSISKLTVLQNHPNPFTGRTELEVGLPAAGSVKIEVYDVAGRHVRTLEVAGQRGWQVVPLTDVDGNGAPLASGVYFARIHAGRETVARKMVIAR